MDNHRKYVCKESCMQYHFFKPFNSMEHNCFHKSVSLTLLDRTDKEKPKKLEDYWRETSNTYSPFGHNVEYSV